MSTNSAGRVLPLCLEFFSSCFSHNVFQEGCDCNWSGGAGLVEPGAEQEEQEEKEEEEKEEERERGCVI